MSDQSANIQDVKKFWDQNPVKAFDIKVPVGSREFFETQHHLKMTETERFAYNFWEFDKHPRPQKILDIGCGPGWLVREFAKNKADITGVDLSSTSIEISKKSLDLFGLDASLIEANAEELPFPDNTFDYLVSSGVLHHTPDTAKAFREAYRVLKPGGEASISLYYKNILLSKRLFPITRTVLNLFSAPLPGRSGMNSAKNCNEFVRMYDGNQNPIGRAYSLKESIEISRPFEWIRHEIHYFPIQFMKYTQLPDRFFRFLDNRFGTMIYMKLRKGQAPR